MMLAKPFDGGKFWHNIQNNFVDSKYRHTHLSEALRSKVEALPWVAKAVCELQSKRGDRAQRYQATVEEKVEWLCRLWPGQERPKQKDSKDIPVEWLRPCEPPAKQFDGGRFWDHIKNNFVDGKRCNTHLSDDLRVKVRALPWVDTAIRELLEKRANAAS